MREDALYGEKDLHNSLMALFLNNSRAESGMERLPQASSARVPSGLWMRETVENVRDEETRKNFKNAIGSTLNQVKSSTFFSAPVMYVMGIYDISRYDRESDKGYLRRSGKEKGWLHLSPTRRSSAPRMA